MSDSKEFLQDLHRKKVFSDFYMHYLEIKTLNIVDRYALIKSFSRSGADYSASYPLSSKETNSLAQHKILFNDIKQKNEIFMKTMKSGKGQKLVKNYLKCYKQYNNSDDSLLRAVHKKQIHENDLLRFSDYQFSNLISNCNERTLLSLLELSYINNAQYKSKIVVDKLREKNHIFTEKMLQHFIDLAFYIEIYNGKESWSQQYITEQLDAFFSDKKEYINKWLICAQKPLEQLREDIDPGTFINKPFADNKLHDLPDINVKVNAPHNTNVKIQLNVTGQALKGHTLIYGTTGQGKTHYFSSMINDEKFESKVELFKITLERNLLNQEINVSPSLITETKQKQRL